MKVLSDLNKLQIFREVVQAGSFSKAALQLKQPKSRVSRHIGLLEKELGLQLIYRTTRQFQLTQAGKELFQRTTPLLNELSNTIEQLASESDEISGIIRVTVPDDIGSELIGKICFEFMNMYPRIQIEVFAANQVVDLVRESIDVAVRIGKAKDSSLIQKKVGMIEGVFVAQPDFLNRHPGMGKLEDLEKVPTLHFFPSPQRPTTLKVSNGREIRNLKISSYFSSNNLFALRSMALLGAGVTYLPLFLVRDSIARGDLAQIFKEWKTEGTPIQILIPHQKETPVKIRKWVEFLASRLAQYL